jgi:tellurite resistance protein
MTRATTLMSMQAAADQAEAAQWLGIMLAVAWSHPALVRRVDASARRLLADQAPD